MRAVKRVRARQMHVDTAKTKTSNSQLPKSLGHWLSSEMRGDLRKAKFPSDCFFAVTFLCPTCFDVVMMIPEVMVNKDNSTVPRGGLRMSHTVN